MNADEEMARQHAIDLLRKLLEVVDDAGEDTDLALAREVRGIAENGIVDLELMGS